MDIAEVYRRLNLVFRDVFNNQNLMLTPKITADDIEEWDSLEHIRLIVSVEKAFFIKFSAAEVGGLKNVGELAELIDLKMKKLR